MPDRAPAPAGVAPWYAPAALAPGNALLHVRGVRRQHAARLVVKHRRPGAPRAIV